MSDFPLAILEIGIILIVARFVGWAFRFIGQPRVIGEMIGGILLGPSVLGLISPHAMNLLFPRNSLGLLQDLSQVGLLLFMFMVGLNVSQTHIRENTRSILVASGVSIALPFLLGVLLAVFPYRNLAGRGALPLHFSLFLGTAMSITAFPVLARILTDLGLLNSRPGVIAISCAAVDDVSAWCILAVITVLARSSGSLVSVVMHLLMLGGYIGIMIYCVKPLLKACRWTLVLQEALPYMFVLVFVSAWVTDALGVHLLFGAFIAGLVIPKNPSLEFEIRTRLESVTVGLLLPVFFAITGLRTQIQLLNTPKLWLACATIILCAVGGKLLGCSLALRMTGIPWSEALAAGALVNTRGLVELIILNIGLELKIISPELFSMMVIMALATTIMATPIVRLCWQMPPSLLRSASGNRLTSPMRSTPTTSSSDRRW
jgi:Kef-type K+ transport system membrane component KefB